MCCCCRQERRQEEGPDPELDRVSGRRRWRRLPAPRLGGHGHGGRGEQLGGGDGGRARLRGAAPAAGVLRVLSVMCDNEQHCNQNKMQVVLPTAPRAALGPGVDDERIPHRPPFTAYIANLPYDVDEGEIMETFEKARLKVYFVYLKRLLAISYSLLQIENVRLMKDEGGRLKGYGYADFSDRDSLVNVLTMDLSVKNRKMRIDLASQAGKDRNDRGGFGDGGFGERRGREEDPNAGRSDASDDWRRGPPPPARDDGRDRDRGGYNGRDSYDRDRYNGRGSGGYGRDREGGRGFSNYEPARERDGGRYGGFSRGGDRDGDRDGGRYGGFSRGDRDGDRDDRRQEREAPKERPKLNLAPRSKPVEDEGSGASSSIFGGAKPVDTLKKEQEMEERMKKEKEEKEKALEEAKKNKPSAASIFGSAKPVDTTQREKEIEEKLSKMSTSEESKDDGPRAYKPPARRDDGDRRRDDRGYDRDRRDDRGGYDRDRRDDRGGYDRRDDRDDRGYDRRDDRGGYDRRRDDRGYDRDRRDDRGGYDRRDDRGSSSGYERDGRDDRGDRDEGRNRDEASEEKEERKKTPEPQMKKYEEPKPAVSCN